jgi:hypothetical protein
MTHTLSVGQIVRVKRWVPEKLSATKYKIIDLLASDRDGVPCYQIASVATGVLWITTQDRIELDDVEVLTADLLDERTV